MKNSKPNTPLNSSICEEDQKNDLSTVSEITNLTQPTENYENGQAEHILQCETPASLHRSFDELFPAENADSSLHRTAIINRYRLDYTASPEHSTERSCESESGQPINNRSFLVQRFPGLSNL